MKTLEPSARPYGWRESFICLILAVICFNLAWASVRFPAASLFIFGYALFLIQLAHQPTVRRAFYFGLAVGFACAAGQAFFFFNIFKLAAVVLWLVFGFWIGFFSAVSCGCFQRWGTAKTIWLIPVLWTGCEYFRSELYYFRFSWLGIGYVFSSVPHFPYHAFGMYGSGFLVVLIVIIVICQNIKQKIWGSLFALALVLLLLLGRHSTAHPSGALKIAGIQLEFPPENVLPVVLDQALRKNPDAPVFVLSEYTLDGPVSNSLKNWCREHSRFLIVGGKDIVTNDIYYDTAFVIGTNGRVIFKQAKAVPIQCFKDGLAATNQDVWNSPWGKIGICICYDLSYVRVTDPLIREGAQLLIVPSMDVEEWGRHEHELHARVAPVRAAEYGVPIFRVASSGISQAVTANGIVVAHTGIPARGEIFSARLPLPSQGALPLDRYLAPICSLITAAVTAVLLFRHWNEKRPNPNPPAA